MRGVGVTVYPRLTDGALQWIGDARPHSVTLHSIADGAAFSAVRKANPDCLVGLGIGCNPFANLGWTDRAAVDWLRPTLDAAKRNRAAFIDLNCESGPLKNGRRTGWVRYARDPDRETEMAALEARAILLLDEAARVGVPILVTTHDYPTMHPAPITLFADNRVSMLRLMRYISTSTKEEKRAKRMDAVRRIRKSNDSLARYAPLRPSVSTYLRGWGSSIAAYGELLDSTDHTNVWALPFLSSRGYMDRLGARATKTAIACRDLAGNSAGAIARAQEALAELGLYDGNIDGILGEQTIAAVNAWREKK